MSRRQGRAGEKGEGMMWELLTQGTLVGIIVDLEHAEEQDWIACDEELHALEDARAQLVALIGQEGADSLIEDSRW